MKNIISLLSLLLASLVLVSGPAVARTAPEDRSRAEQIIWSAYETAYFQGEDVQSRASMKITDNQGRTRTRELTILRKNVGEYSQKYYAYFHAPPDLRRMVFLVWTNPGKDDDRWLYLPSIDLVQRITGSQKRNAFAGSNFTYEDMTGRYPGNDTFEYIGEETLDGRTVQVVEGTPKNPEMVEFSRYRVYVDPKTQLPVKSVFYNPQGDKHRTLTIEETSTVQGFVTPTVQVAVNHQTGSRTRVEMTDVQYNNGLPERVFEKRYLRRPPTPWVNP